MLSFFGGGAASNASTAEVAPPASAAASTTIPSSTTPSTTTTTTSCTSYRLEPSVDYIGGDLTPEPVNALDQEACCAACETSMRCNAFTYIAASHDCWLKMHRRHARARPQPNTIVSGARNQLKTTTMRFGGSPGSVGAGASVVAGAGSAQRASIWDRIRARRAGAGAAVTAGVGGTGFGGGAVRGSAASAYGRRYSVGGGSMLSSDDALHRSQERQAEFLFAKASEQWRGVTRCSACAPLLRLSFSPLNLSSSSASSFSSSLWLGWWHEGSAQFASIVEVVEPHVAVALANRTRWSTVKAQSATAATAITTSSSEAADEAGGAEGVGSQGGVAAAARELGAAAVPEGAVATAAATPAVTAEAEDGDDDGDDDDEGEKKPASSSSSSSTDPNAETAEAAATLLSPPPPSPPPSPLPSPPPPPRRLPLQFWKAALTPHHLSTATTTHWLARVSTWSGDGHALRYRPVALPNARALADSTTTAAVTPVRFLVAGELPGGSHASPWLLHALLAEARGYGYALVLTTGGLCGQAAAAAAAGGGNGGGEIAQCHRAVAPLLTAAAVMPAAGRTDAALEGGCGASWAERWWPRGGGDASEEATTTIATAATTTASVEDAGDGSSSSSTTTSPSVSRFGCDASGKPKPLWYSFTRHHVLFLSLSAAHPIGEHSVQRGALKALTKAKRASGEASWVVAYSEWPTGVSSPYELQKLAGGLGADVLFVRPLPSEAKPAAIYRSGAKGHATVVSLGLERQIYARVEALNKTALHVERVGAADGRVTDAITIAKGGGGGGSSKAGRS